MDKKNELKRLHFIMNNFSIKEIVSATVGQAALKKEMWWFEKLAELYSKAPEE